MSHYLDDGVGSFKKPLRVRTLVFEASTNQQVAWLDAPVWPPVGAVIEIPDPHPRDAVVLGVRMGIDPGVGRESDEPVNEAYATITIDVWIPESGRIIPRPRPS